MNRWLRRILLAGAALLLLVAGAVALLQIPPVATWLGRQLAGLAPLAPGVELEIGRVSGNWLSGLALENLRLRNERGELATIRSVRLRYDLRNLAGADRRIRELVVDGARVRARRDSAGWDIARVLRQSTDTAGGGSFAIDRVELRGVDLVAELAPDSLIRVENLQLRAHDLALGETATATLDTVHARVLPPSDPPLWLDLAARGEVTPELFRLDPFRVATRRSELAGRAVLPRSYKLPRIVDQLSVQVAATPLALEDVAAVLPAVAGEGDLQLDARVEAEGRRATGRILARLGEARATLEGSTLLGPGVPAEYQVTSTIRHLDPARLSAGAPAGDLNVSVGADLRGPTLAESQGTAEIRLTDSRVGATAVRDLLLRTELDAGRADLELRGLVEKGRIRASGWVRPFDSIPSYRLAGTAARLPGTDSLAPLLAGAAGDPFLEIGFRFSGSGISAKDARVRARADLAAVRSDGGRTPVGAATLAVADRRVDARPELLVAGGRVSANLTARLDQPVSYELRRGVIDSVDLGRLLADTVAAPVSGRFTLRGQGTAPAEANVVARLALDEIRYGARRVEQVTADVRLDRGRAGLELRGGLQGGRIGVDAEGRPLDSVPTFAVRRGTIDTVDLGTLLGRPDLGGPVTARLTASGRWGEEDRALSGRVRIEPSRLGHIEV
ncbi:MAG: hypothetical protein H0W29_10605, partial [Gemmatimonadales bacterium]|nr:hypothetical protein [Gemmatimonadales bacterium]